MRTWLLDTGPLVAYLDSGDPAHPEVAAHLDAFSGQLVTTGAVITEAMHFLSASLAGPSVLAELMVTSGTRIHDLAQPLSLLDAAELMRKYTDTPMDYADATLVLLAEQLNVTDVLTLDRRGFTVYRTRQKKCFHLVLDAPLIAS